MIPAREKCRLEKSSVVITLTREFCILLQSWIVWTQATLSGMHSEFRMLSLLVTPSGVHSEFKMLRSFSKLLSARKLKRTHVLYALGTRLLV